MKQIISELSKYNPSGFMEIKLFFGHLCIYCILNCIFNDLNSYVVFTINSFWILSVMEMDVFKSGYGSSIIYTIAYFCDGMTAKII